ncbi:hypothetical protein JAAARDRAFT_180712 [Jaapia argillacea MUCL 33604]|uniref:Mitochondrial distribution and morphology protein family 31/32 n=1 Tax=Jaapia argillacea MUCL 33604 TaxID=933084 RepID=A0A067PX34_9AGAM|nr:hypothetical protein JAAARDRAFT_180712 [Jaapia argillacea MUCL 33604]
MRSLAQGRGFLRLQSSSSVREGAVCDRYTTIRNFFKRSNPPRLSTASSRTKICSTSYNRFQSISAAPRPSYRISANVGRYAASFHSSSRRAVDPPKPDESTSPKLDAERNHDESIPDKPGSRASQVASGSDPPRIDNYPPLFQRLALSLPHLHRPTRDDFLKVASGFWERFSVHFKWITIRSFRKFNADDISAFVTWFIMSQTLWIFVGTTTFFSVIFAIANSLRLQESVARSISNYLTRETGITVIFESAIVPKWKDSRISLKNVYISRRPPSASAIAAPDPKKVAKGPHGLAVGYDDHSEDDLNYSMFDLNIDSIDVTLSLTRWLDGRGLVKDAVIKGVRGVLDRRSITWDPDHPLDPATFRHQSQAGDFDLDSLQLEDLLITVCQPGNFRPYTASIFRADLKRFRKQWMFYDFLCAENVVGQFDNCLFSLHTPQSIGRTTEKELGEAMWGRMSRLRIDGVNIDHLQSMTTHEGPISWITSGKLDAVLDIKFPRGVSESDAFNVLFDAITTSVAEHIPGQRELARPPLSAPGDDDEEEREGEGNEKVVVDIDLRFRDIKAAVPLFTRDLSYVNLALTRTIVAFMNANRTLIPIRCRVVQDLSVFDGSWTMWETGLTDAIAAKTYDALAYHVTQANFNRRIKTVSLWTLQQSASAVLSALRTIVDPMTAHLKEAYANAQAAASAGMELTVEPGVMIEAS